MPLQNKKTRENNNNKEDFDRTTDVERWLESDNNWLEVRSIEEVFDGWSNGKSMIEPLVPTRSFGYSKLERKIIINQWKKFFNHFWED